MRQIPSGVTRISSERKYIDRCYILDGEEKLPVHAHKLMLISRSPVFQAKLDGQMAEKGEIKIPDISKETFSLLLQYMYTDHVVLDVQSVMSVMAAARKYCIDLLIEKCKVFINESINIKNVGVLLECAHTYKEEEVMSQCLGLIQKKPLEFFQLETFISLCQECVCRVSKADELQTFDEHDVFEAAMRWSGEACERQGLEITDTNRRKVLGSILYEIRFPLMSDGFIASEICGGDLLTAEEIKTALRTKHKKDTSDMFKGSMRTERKLLRFVRFSEHKEMSYGAIKDATVFSVSRSGYLAGILFRGAKNEVYSFNEVKIFDDQANCLAKRNDFSISACSVLGTIEVLLLVKILLKESMKYSIYATTSGYGKIAEGQNGKSTIEIGATKVDFLHHPDSKYQSVRQGLIHGIIFG